MGIRIPLKPTCWQIGCILLRQEPLVNTVPGRVIWTGTGFRSLAVVSNKNSFGKIWQAKTGKNIGVCKFSFCTCMLQDLFTPSGSTIHLAIASSFAAYMYNLFSSDGTTIAVGELMYTEDDNGGSVAVYKASGVLATQYVTMVEA
eukprot:scaffold4075_cov63-Cylindrotheca_fusiformis.AAC.3